MCSFTRARRVTAYQRMLLSALIILLAASSAPAPGHALKEEQAEATVPFDGANDLVVVDALLDGKGPFRFLLDSGASDHVVSLELAKALQLKIEGAGVIDVGSGKMADAGLTQVASIKVGGAQLESQRFFVAAFPPAYPFQGFLGAEMFRRFVIRIDFARSLLTLTRPAGFRYEGGGTVLPLKLYGGGIPMVRGEIDGNKGWLKLDTGYNGTLALFGKFIEEHKLLKKYAPLVSDEGGQTLAGDAGKAKLARVALLKLGALEMKDLRATLFVEKGSTNDAFAGATGTGVFKQFNIIFNYSGQQVIFEKR